MNRKRVLGPFILIFLLMIMAFAVTEGETTSPETTIYVAPSTITVPVNQTLFVNINISDVTDIYGWEFKLKWNSTLLDALNVTEGNFLKSGGDTYLITELNNTEGYLLAACTLLGNTPGVNGSGTLATIEFKTESEGESILDLYDTKLVSSLVQSITHAANDGNVTISNSNPVGGIWIPVNKLELLAPWMTLASVIAVATAVVFLRHRKKRRPIFKRKPTQTAQTPS